MKIEKTLEEIKVTSEFSRSNSKLKIHLDNIPITNNSDLLMDYTRECRTILLPKKPRGLRKEQSKNKSNNTSLNTTRSRKLIPNLDLSDYAFSSQRNVNDLEEDKLIETQIKKNYIWNQEKELIFKGHRKGAKRRMFNEIKSSSFTEVAFSPLVQASQIDEKSKLQRDTKLAKYINGDALSPEEYKFLANTSRSLNSHVDKKLLQTTINHLDSSVIEAVIFLFF